MWDGPDGATLKIGDQLHALQSSLDVSGEGHPAGYGIEWANFVGGPPIIRADETWPLPARPIGLYSLTKGLAEQRAIAANSLDLATVVVRPRLVWGQGDTTLLLQRFQPPSGKLQAAEPPPTPHADVLDAYLALPQRRVRRRLARGHRGAAGALAQDQLLHAAPGCIAVWVQAFA